MFLRVEYIFAKLALLRLRRRRVLLTGCSKAKQGAVILSKYTRIVAVLAF